MEMDEGARLWLYQTARKNHWRVRRWYDYEDVVQEGFECYAYVLEHYPAIVDRPHMMSLFKLTFMSRVTDLSNAARRRPDCLVGDMFPVHVSQTMSEGDLWERVLVGEIMSDAADEILILAKAPEPIRRVLLLFSSDEGRRRLRSVYRLKQYGVRETFNARLARLAGFDPAIDIRDLFHSYLNGDPNVTTG